MTKDEARIVLLEQALQQARDTIQFLHGCLTSPSYRYLYPEHTERRIEQIDTLVGQEATCLHSTTIEDCSSCLDRVRRWKLKDEAQRTLAE